MQRIKFSETSLPALGLGCMRLPTLEDGRIDESKTKSMIELAMANGVNYFDTGYDYHGGDSERVLGRLLSHYPRDSFFIADKFPGYAPLNWRRVEKIFEEQLFRLGIDHFDFYLFHNVCEMNIDAYTSPKYGIFDYLCLQKQQGRIKHLGFSAHGSVETMRKFLLKYGDKMEFAQIQLNYIDYEFQHAKEKLMLLSEYSIPVFVMEPLRGGKLVSLRAPYNTKFSELFGKTRPHEAAFRFVKEMPQVALTLSGMSSFEQLSDNIKIFSEHSPLTDDQIASLISLAHEMTSEASIPCTACGYCSSHCPKGLDIPRFIEYYNEHRFSGGGFIVPSAVASMNRDKRPDACIGCRLCETVCPQNINASEILSELSEMIRPKG